MNKHTVFVAGKRFILLSDDKEDYVQNLAAEVGEAISKITLDNPTLDRRSAAILCALDYADDKQKEIMRCKSLSQKAQPLINQADKQAKMLKDLKEKLEAKDNEIEKLKKELKDLRAAFEKSTRFLSGTDAAKPASVKPEKRQEQNYNKGYKPVRQYSLFDDEK